jgi:hypothetical protein
MAVTITDNRTIINQADANTGWTSTATLTAGTSDPTPVESTGRLGLIVSTSTHNSYITISSTDMSSGYLIYFWLSHRAALDTTTNGGLMIQVGDGTDRIGFHLAGSDKLGFIHSDGPVTWQCLCLDTANLGAFSNTAFAGSYAALSNAAVTQLGVAFKTLVKSVGGVENCFIDIGRYMNPAVNDGCAITITGGTSGDPGTFAQIATADRGIADQQAHGIVRELGAGLYGVQGPIRFGNPTGTSSSWFEDTNVSVVFEDRDFQTTKYKIVIVDNGTGTTTFKLGTKVGTGTTATGTDGCNLIAPSGVGASFDAATDTDVTDVFIYGTTFDGFTQGISFRSGHEFIGGRILTSGQITANGATMVNSQVSGSTATSALLWNVNTDTDNLLDGMSFSMGTSGHGIELGANTPSTITFDGITFTGYGGTPGSNLVASSGSTDAAVYNNSGKAITINITSGGSTPSVRNGALATTTVNNNITVTVTVQDQSATAIVGAQVAVYKTSDDSTIIASTATNGSGQVSGSTAASAGAVYIRVRQSNTTDSPRYYPTSTVGTIGTGNFDVTVTMVEDTTVS